MTVLADLLDAVKSNDVVKVKSIFTEGMNEKVLGKIEDTKLEIGASLSELSDQSDEDDQDEDDQDEDDENEDED